MNLSSSLEEYLKTIYILENTNEKVKVTTIANKLNCTKPSVNRALNNLRTEKLIEYESYGDIKLTDFGLEIAREIVKRQDTLKLFLTEVLDVPEERADEEARQMKHSVSEETITSLEKYINKILDLGDLDCGYDANSEKCRNCVKITARNRLKKEKERK